MADLSCKRRCGCWVALQKGWHCSVREAAGGDLQEGGIWTKSVEVCPLDSLSVPFAVQTSGHRWHFLIVATPENKVLRPPELLGRGRMVLIPSLFNNLDFRCLSDYCWNTQLCFCILLNCRSRCFNLHKDVSRTVCLGLLGLRISCSFLRSVMEENPPLWEQAKRGMKHKMEQKVTPNNCPFWLVDFGFLPAFGL